MWTIDKVANELHETVAPTKDYEKQPVEVDPSTTGLGQVVHDVAQGMPKGVSKAKIKISLKAAEPRFDPEDAGTWFDSTEGVEMGSKIQSLAHEHGWEGPIVSDPEDEQYFESTKLAQDYLNGMVPENYHFGYDEEGNWGMFESAVAMEELPGRVPEAHEDLGKEEGAMTTASRNKMIQVKAQSFSEEDAGPWFEAARGVYVGGEIQKLAERYGWTGPVMTDTEDEQYFSQSKSAEDFMQQLAPAGYYFGMSDEGDWGLWKLTPEGEQEVAAPKFATMYKKAAAPGDPPYQAPTGMRWVNRGNQWTLVPDSEAQQMIAGILNRVTLASEFREELYPERLATIDVQDRVYVRPLRTMGTVIRVKGDAYRVEVQVPDLTNVGNKKKLVNTYWAQELEAR